MTTQTGRDQSPEPMSAVWPEQIPCSRCGKAVSSWVPKGTTVRAWVECPECIEKQPDLEAELASAREEAEKAYAAYRLEHFGRGVDLRQLKEAQEENERLRDQLQTVTDEPCHIDDRKENADGSQSRDG